MVWHTYEDRLLAHYIFKTRPVNPYRDGVAVLCNGDIHFAKMFVSMDSSLPTGDVRLRVVNVFDRPVYVVMIRPLSKCCPIHILPEPNAAYPNRDLAVDIKMGLGRVAPVDRTVGVEVSKNMNGGDECDHGLGEPLEVLEDEECLMVIKEMKKDRKDFNFYTSLLYEIDGVRLVDETMSLQICAHGGVRPLPCVYTYLNDVSFTNVARILKITHIDWANARYCTVFITIPIYPIFKNLWANACTLPKQEVSVRVGHQCMLQRRPGIDLSRGRYEDRVIVHYKSLMVAIKEMLVERDVNEMCESLINTDILYSYRFVCVAMFALRLQAAVYTYMCACPCNSENECRCENICSTVLDIFGTWKLC
ncbi:Hypothetical predicted protein [Paramuricea clavata]|uniref:Uncharacterized protein n=1 Tax=Paramuricea clavata TaxID=317549 RepID=A0A7D9HH06_PARCT|nr:Hypothetical predicted protein [Paramuricea clavata]